jgi:integral membrane protein
MLKTSLGRYRLLAYIVGTLLIVLVFAGVPLQWWANFPYVAKYVGMLHGFLYLVYCVTCLELMLRYRLGWIRLFLMAAAGFVPFLSFVMERKTTHMLEGAEAELRRRAVRVSASAD